MDNSSIISVHSSDFDSDICSKLEKDLTEALSTSPRKADDGGVTTAMANVTSPLPDIKLPISTSTPAHPNILDTVPCPMTSTIIDLDELDSNLNETPEPTPPTTLDQEIPSPTKGLACPNTQDTVPDIRDNSTSHPQNISMTDLNDNDNAGTRNVAVADDDVAVPDMVPTAGPNQPRAKPITKTSSKPSGNAPTPVPGRANNDKHWRSKINRETRTTRTPAFWGYPPPPRDFPYYWPVHFESQVHTIDQFISDPKSKEGESRKN